MIFEIEIPKIKLETECSILDNETNMYIRETIIGGAMFIISSKYQQILSLLKELIELHTKKIEFLELININQISKEIKQPLTYEYLITKEIMKEFKMKPNSVISIGDITGTCLDAFTKIKTRISLTKGQSSGKNTEVKYINNVNVEVHKPTQKSIDVIFCWSEGQTDEKDSAHHILSQMAYSLGMLSDKGHIVIKMFGIMTPISIKLVYVLGQFFQKVHIMKPKIVDQKTHDIYIIGSNYSYNQSIIVSLLELQQLLKDESEPLQDITIKSSNNNTNQELYKISRYLQNERYKYISIYHDFLYNKNFHDKVFLAIQDKQKKNTIEWIKEYLS